MGLTSSTADNYVLRIDETKATVNINVVHKPTVTKMPSKVAVVPTHAKSNAMLKQSSSTAEQLIPLHKAPSNRSTATMLTQASSKVFQTKSSATATRCSDKVPWLLKNGSFSGVTLQDLEYGRVIGKLSCISLSFPFLLIFIF